VDFDSFLEKTLVVEVAKQKPGYNIIRRRIAIIISQWITIKMAKEKKPIVYQIFQHLLDKSDPMNDQVVRITAGRKFHAVADEWEFQADAFLPYSQLMLDRLMALVQEVELPETKMALLNTISLVVYRLEHHVSQQHGRKVLELIWIRSHRMLIASSPSSHPYGSSLARSI
jgi:hypothetical protein